MEGQQGSQNEVEVQKWQHGFTSGSSNWVSGLGCVVELVSGVNCRLEDSNIEATVHSVLMLSICGLV